jgi:hypothetical protein
MKIIEPITAAELTDFSKLISGMKFKSNLFSATPLACITFGANEFVITHFFLFQDIN